MNRVSIVDWERDIYAQGLQVNSWPYDEVVSWLSAKVRGRDPSTIRVLELGCGTGNNLRFFGELGCQVFGIDGSETAVNLARERLRTIEVRDVDLRIGSINNLPWPENFFDFVVDRACLTQNPHHYINATLKEVYRVLKINGEFLSTGLFSLADNDLQFGKLVSYNTYDSFSSGRFKGVGLTSFFEEEDLRKLFADFRIQHLKRVTIRDIEGSYAHEYFSVGASR